MNWLLIIVILVLAGNIVWGFSKGFLRVVYSMLAWIAILIFVTWATPHVADMLAKTTNIDNRIEAGLNDKLHELVEGDTEEELLDQGIKPNTIRLSIGTENIADIIEDLDEAFRAVEE